MMKDDPGAVLMFLVVCGLGIYFLMWLFITVASFIEWREHNYKGPFYGPRPKPPYVSKRKRK